MVVLPYHRMAWAWVTLNKRCVDWTFSWITQFVVTYTVVELHSEGPVQCSSIIFELKSQTAKVFLYYIFFYNVLDKCMHNNHLAYPSHCWAQASSHNGRAWCGLGTEHTSLNASMYSFTEKLMVNFALYFAHKSSHIININPLLQRQYRSHHEPILYSIYQNE